MDICFFSPTSMTELFQNKTLMELPQAFGFGLVLLRHRYAHLYLVSLQVSVFIRAQCFTILH